MTTTAAINAQSVGTSSNVGEDLLAYKLTPQSTTDRFFVEALLTNGAGGYDMAQRPRIWYACHSVSMTAALAPKILKQTARYLEIVPSPFSGKQVARVSQLEPLSAAYVYLWLEMPAVTVAQTLTVNLIEGP